MIIIKEVKEKKTLKEFINFPFKLYKNDPLYSPELIKDQMIHFSEKNPFVKHSKVKYFLAIKGAETVGRIASIVNPVHIKYHNEKVGFFGFFESINDEEVVLSLFETVAKDLEKENMELIRGPMNFSTNEQCGILIEGFQYTPMLMTPYNPPYYQNLLEKIGFTKVKDLFAYIKKIPETLPKKIYKVANIAKKKGIKVRKANIKNLYNELQIFKNIYNEAWSKNWGFIPISNEELKYMANRLKPIVIPELMLIAEKDGIPIGFLGIIPDFNLILRKMKGHITPLSIIKALYYKKKIKDIRLFLLGVNSLYRLKGVDALLFTEAFKAAKHYERIEFSWILEDNLSVIHLIKMIEGKLYKRFRVYETVLKGLINTTNPSIFLSG